MAAGLLALAGCAGPHSGGVKLATLTQQVPVTHAFMMPPPGGPAVLSVIENRYTNGLAQDIILENYSDVPGQNLLIVRAFGPMGRDAGTGRLPEDLLGLTDIRRELRERFPGVHMEVSGLYAQNRYGPLSYAVGRARGSNCIYVWQRIAAEQRVFSFRRGAITWRLRLCDPKASARELLLVGYALSVNAYFDSPTWDPYDLPEPDPRIGKPGVSIFPEQVVDPTIVPPTTFGERRREKAAPQRRRRRRPAAPPPTAQDAEAAPAPSAPPVLNVPVPGAAVVPRPENTDLTEPSIREAPVLPAPDRDTLDPEDSLVPEDLRPEQRSAAPSEVRRAALVPSANSVRRADERIASAWLRVE